ncbi:MAG TPA: carbohydrate kinase family protein [bacterium]|nr:carbohydrate kinase family protein [bacterium]HPN43318.1 carbohydrate kinase family protein [bacterium]
MFDVTVIGNVGIDTNIYYGDGLDSRVESNFTENIDCIGQAGGYASRGFARLGLNTAFIGFIGNDANGRFIKDVFNDDGINTEGLYIDHAGTNRSINFMYRDGRRKNFYDGKSHMTLLPDLEKCRTILHASRLVHFNIPNWARRLLPIARECGAKISCDIQDVTDVYDPYRQDFINHADIIFFSCVNHASPQPIIESLLKLNSNLTIVAGMGVRGCALGTVKGIQFFEAIELDAPVVDTNGAGDSLAVGFLSSYIIDGYSPQDSVLRGQIAARYVCTLKANSDHLITRRQLDEYFKRYKKQ